VLSSVTSSAIRSTHGNALSVAVTAFLSHHATMASSADLRQHPRMAVALPMRVQTTLGIVESVTVNISRRGVRAHIVPPPSVASEVRVTLHLPNGIRVSGIGRCRSRLPDGVCGLELELSGESLTHWNEFIDEEEATGGLWRMIGRAARAPEDALGPRGLHVTVASSDLLFHTVGENGEAYRIAFDKHPSDPIEQCDLVKTLPGFKELAQRLVSAVLREPLTLKLDDRSAAVTVRVAKIQVGGYAWIQGDGIAPTSLIALTGGELVLVARNGASVFPHFTQQELERIACDAFRTDLPSPVFSGNSSHRVVDAEPPDPSRPTPADLPPPPNAARAPATANGFLAVRAAQTAASDVQIRRYGDKDIFFYPSVWARVREGTDGLMGPTMHDGIRVSILALIGSGTPRVVHVDEQSAVELLKPPQQ
jgi:hypothetical protein